ncbi:hypothetical protein AB0B66_11830 [Catellatospora sp. NPDC049111]|uniref:hypothetical protein n=1 Tax=Catellatospora sp. NPDC049111 TaxID=3155271 RepID=UPI0034088F35
MGYLVHPSGRLNLPESQDAAAVAAVKAAWRDRRGWYDPQSEHAYSPSGTLADIAEFAAASITRDGDWIEFEYDDGNDPKWSDQATAFYVAIAPFVRSGAVCLEGEDGGTWSYSYADGQITQQGWNGWDGTIEPFGEQVDFPAA